MLKLQKPEYFTWKANVNKGLTNILNTLVS